MQSISSPDELNGRLQHTSPATWIVLSAVTVSLIAFFVWSFLARLPLKLTGTAEVNDHVATLRLKEGDLRKLSAGLKVTISGEVGEIVSISGSEVTLSSYDLPNGEYPYRVDLGSVRPIDFFIGNPS